MRDALKAFLTGRGTVRSTADAPISRPEPVTTADRAVHARAVELLEGESALDEIREALVRYGLDGELTEREVILAAAAMQRGAHTQAVPPAIAAGAFVLAALSCTVSGIALATDLGGIWFMSIGVLILATAGLAVLALVLTYRSLRGMGPAIGVEAIVKDRFARGDQGSTHTPSP